MFFSPYCMISVEKMISHSSDTQNAIFSCYRQHARLNLQKISDVAMARYNI